MPNVATEVSISVSPDMEALLVPQLKLLHGSMFIIDTATAVGYNVIIPLPKKGDLSLMTNYRGISLMSIAAKVYNKILLNRIRPHIDPLLRSNQAGFRSGRSCAQQIHSLKKNHVELQGVTTSTDSHLCGLQESLWLHQQVCHVLSITALWNTKDSG